MDAEAMASYVNGTLGDGTGTNTLAYSASGGNTNTVINMKDAPVKDPAKDGDPPGVMGAEMTVKSTRIHVAQNNIPLLYTALVFLKRIFHKQKDADIDGGVSVTWSGNANNQDSYLMKNPRESEPPIRSN